MIVDASAILAILFQEAEAARYAAAIAAAPDPKVSAATVIEVGVVLLHREGPEARDDLEEFLQQSGLRVEPVLAAQIPLALDAHERFGKGMGHPARLNFGDRFAYALARATGEPLLFKGDDFARTDVTPYP